MWVAVMSVTVSVRRSAQASNASSSTTYGFSLGANATAGATLVLVITADNSATTPSAGGANNIDSVADTQNNIWTKRQSPLFDNGAASAGIQGAWFDTQQTVGTLTTSDTITVTFGNNTLAKAVCVYELYSSDGHKLDYFAGNVGTGATAANGQITTDSLNVNNVVLAAYHAENVAAVTGDSDTTRGTWDTQQTATVGATTSGIRHASQTKVVTAAGTQSYDVTVTSQDRIVSWVAYKEVAYRTFTASAAIRVGQTGSVSADAIARRSQSGSASTDAVVQRVQGRALTADAIVAAGATVVTGSVAADAIVHRGQSGSASTDAIVLRARSGSITVDAIVHRGQTGEFFADAIVRGLAQTIAGSFAADSILGVVGRCVWTYPADNEVFDSPMELRFIMPQAISEMHFQIELDRVDTFDSADLITYDSSVDQTGWTYWNDSTWTSVIVSGVPASFNGREARLIAATSMTAGTWYRRVRAGVII